MLEKALMGMVLFTDLKIPNLVRIYDTGISDGFHNDETSSRPVSFNQSRFSYSNHFLD